MLGVIMEARATKAASQAAPAVTTLAPKLPKAPTAMVINLTGIASLIGALACLRTWAVRVPEVPATLICIGALAFPIILLEAIFLKAWKRPSTGFDFSHAGAPHYGRAVAKVLGFYATLGFGLGLYALFPEYRGGFYERYYQMLRWVLPVVAALSIPYFLVLERFNKKPLDGYWQMSQLVMLRFRKLDRAVLGQHLLGWTVKAFFTPLMFIYCSNAIGQFRSIDPKVMFFSFGSFFDITYDSLFGFDVVIAVTGYLLTIRLFDSHIRSTEPSILGWVVAVGCYQPFWSFFDGNYLNYGAGGTTWGFWFGGKPVAYVLWGTVILFLTAVYLSATMPFGIRFSNLTNRGILSNGPYRFTKHPAYVSKNLSWWMISMPFLSTASWAEALRHSLMLLGLNFAYFMRARTEERHLSRDPDYVAYATAMERRGIFRWVGKLLPVLKFTPGKLFNV